MQELIIIFLIIIAGIFATLYILQCKEIRNIANQLKEINKIQTNSKILLSSSSKWSEKLTLEINKILKEKQKSEVEHKKMDLEIRQAISNMSHDLRTPLTSIMGYIQLMEEEDLCEDEKKEYIDIVKKRTKSLQALINSFYDLSRLEGKEYKFYLKSMNLYNILCDTIALFYNDFLDKGMEPIINLEEKLPQVIVDDNAVRRIISNLIQNTLKYSKEFINISLRQQEKYIIMTFTNDAKDLNKEDVDSLFNRFFTADRTRTGKNTGLGLAITKELVEQMGHEIFAELLEDKLSIIIKWKIRYGA